MLGLALRRLVRLTREQQLTRGAGQLTLRERRLAHWQRRLEQWTRGQRRVVQQKLVQSDLQGRLWPESRWPEQLRALRRQRRQRRARRMSQPLLQSPVRPAPVPELWRRA